MRAIMLAMSGLDAWWSGGERVSLVVGERERTVFLRSGGEGPRMTLLHGFPSSSHDWAKVAPGLAEHHALLMFDFLGFGASEKPADHDLDYRTHFERRTRLHGEAVYRAEFRKRGE